jgi:ribonuclease E
MLINATSTESRVAITDGGKLQNLHIESVDRGRLRGNIYKGTIVRVEPAIQACFVDFGGERNGFLAVSDISKQWWRKGVDGKRPRIEDIVRNGNHLIVQCTREPEGNKGAALTTQISLPGRYTVLIPNTDNIGGISKKIESHEERKRLKSALDKLGTKLKGHSTIVRTVGTGRTKAEIERDLNHLLRFWAKIQEAFKRSKRPGALFLEQDVTVRCVRDYFTSDMEKVLIDDAEAYSRVISYVQAAMPRLIKRFEHYEGSQPLFASAEIEPQIEETFHRQVGLPSGGSIVIDRTEALVAIDINSGKSMGGKSMEDTALSTNLEAASEIARQLRLRDLGGLIVIDFIDLRFQRNRTKIESCLKKAMKHDKARHNIGRISQFGLLEMSRQRIQGSVDMGSFEICKSCEGTGLIRSIASCKLAAFRKIQSLLHDTSISEVQAQLPMEVAYNILNEMRDTIGDLEKTLGVTIKVYPMHLSRNEIGNFYTTKGDRKAVAQPAGQTLLLTADEEATVVDPEETQEENAGDSGAASVPEEGERKRGRRRRGRRRGRSRQEEAAEVLVDNDFAKVAAEAESDDSDEENPERKRRRRRRRGRGRGESRTEELPVVNTADEAPESDDVPESLSPALPSSEPDSEEGGKRRGRRRRRGRSKSAPSTSEVLEAKPIDEEEAPVQEPAEDIVAADAFHDAANTEEAGAKKVGRRRTRKRRGSSKRPESSESEAAAGAEEESAKEESDNNDVASDEAASSQSNGESEEKPARKRRGRRRTARSRFIETAQDEAAVQETKSETETTSEPLPADVEEEAAAEKNVVSANKDVTDEPKKGRRRRGRSKASQSKGGVKEESSSNDGPKDTQMSPAKASVETDGKGVSDANVADEESAPDKKSDTDEETPKETLSPELSMGKPEVSEGQAEPTRKRRRTRRKPAAKTVEVGSADNVKADGGGDEAVSEEAPKRRRRRGRSISKTEEE